MIFKEKTIDEILLIEDKTDMVSELYNYLIGKSNDGEDLSKLTDIEKVIYLCQSFQLETDDGGFYRFFFDASGNYTDETIDDLKIIKALDTSKILEEISSKFPNGKASVNINERQDFMNDEETSNIIIWEEYNQSFYKNSDNLIELCYSYAIENRDSFKQ